MTGKDLWEFIDDLYCNAETEFVLDGQAYIVEGWRNADGTYTIELNAVGDSPRTLFSHTSTSRQEVVETFESAKVFGGKTIYDIEKDISVLYG